MMREEVKSLLRSKLVYMLFVIPPLSTGIAIKCGFDQR